MTIIVAVELEQEFTAYEDVPNHYVVSIGKGETIKTSGVAAFYKMKDGKISSVRVYCTLNEYNAQIFKDVRAINGNCPWKSITD